MKNINVNLPGMGLLIIFLFTLTFCGTPDLHDGVIKRIETCN